MSSKLLTLSTRGGGGRGRLSSSSMHDMLLSNAELRASSCAVSVPTAVSPSAAKLLPLHDSALSSSVLLCWATFSLSRDFLERLFRTAFLSRVPPAPRLMLACPLSTSISWSVSRTKPQVVLVSGSLAVAVGLFFIVPPTGKSLSNPSSKPLDLSLKHPLLEEERDDLENDRLRLKPRSRVPTGVTPVPPLSKFPIMFSPEIFNC